MHSPRYLLLLILPVLAACRPVAPPEPDLSSVIDALDAYIQYEMADKGLPSVSITLVDGPDIVWSNGYGTAQPASGALATGQTVYRVASLSKLFTAMAVMQLVEQGRLDLDAPIETYLPDFKPANPFGTPVTLRQVHSHRSGLVREPPVGHYFDPDEPSIEATVASLNQTALIYAPTTRTKYSNAAVTVAGRVVEAVVGEPFADYVDRALLHPMGMTTSSFAPRPTLRAGLAEGTMWTYDGRTFPAPVFELGMAPAANLYTTMDDLGRFMTVLFAGGIGPDGATVISPASLDTMWTVQFAGGGDPRAPGFGLGFFVDAFEGARRVQHSGVMYGYATRLAALPDERLGVAVVGTMDAANDAVDRIGAYALRLLRAHKASLPLPGFERFTPVDSLLARRLDGRYESNGAVRELIERNGELYLFNGLERHRLRMRGDSLITDDRLAHGYTLLPEGDALIDAAGQRFVQVAPTRPAAPYPHHAGLIGEYGWDHNTLYVFERDGQLWTLIEWFFYYPLTEVSPDVYRMPAYGLYPDETLTFTRDAQGRGLNASLVGVDFERRRIEPDGGATFKINPVRPVETLRSEAMAATPPAQPDSLRAPDLVELSTLDPTFKLDIRYATTNNFMGAVFYQQPRAFLQRPAAEALVRAGAELKKQGLGIVVYDGYRPWAVTKMFWEATPEHQHDFVADPAKGSRHNRGCAIDIGLYDLATGNLVPMPSGYDEFSPRAFPDYPGGSALERWHRELLRDIMEEAGFTVYEWEWWHFDFNEWGQYPVLNVPFEAL
ncbi:MAG: serine hydrolase [Rhodothermales bacterium]|nr:serine hydrolase [Rhodothermales bacterium]